MTSLLYAIIEFITYVHEKVLTWNDNYEYNFTDKQLHFLLIGVLGMALVFAVHPVFKFLAERKMTLAVTWIYVFTVLIVITFAIEIGQRLTKTGTMDFRDIVYGLGGFFLMFAIFWFVRLIIKLFIYLLFGRRKKEQPQEDEPEEETIFVQKPGR